MKEVWSYHMLFTPYLAKDLPLDKEIPTLYDPKIGLVITKGADGKLMVNDAEMIKPDFVIHAGKSKIHIIRAFLVPMKLLGRLLAELKPGTDLGVASGQVDSDPAAGDSSGSPADSLEKMLADSGALGAPAAKGAGPEVVVAPGAEAGGQVSLLETAKGLKEVSILEVLLRSIQPIRDYLSTKGLEVTVFAPSDDGIKVRVWSVGSCVAARAPPRVLAAAAVSRGSRVVQPACSRQKAERPTPLPHPRPRPQDFMRRTGRHLGKLVANDSLLVDVVNYHIVPGVALSTADLKKVKSVTTRGGYELAVTNNGWVGWGQGIGFRARPARLLVRAPVSSRYSSPLPQQKTTPQPQPNPAATASPTSTASPW
jgi:uncharacterized surface protein with fasciclin (FAS1) repeats